MRTFLFQFIQPCNFADTDQYMVCKMPAIGVPFDILPSLNVTTYKEIVPFGSDPSIVVSDNANWTCPVEASYGQPVSPNANPKTSLVITTSPQPFAGFYVGFQLDGFKGYRNVSDNLTDVSLILFAPPEICFNSTIETISILSHDNVEITVCVCVFLLGGCVCCVCLFVQDGGYI